ncbi:phage tail protein [Alysiella crassa]|uniref:Phage tail protein n=1 Tax=Alysiella crassa TaxID=153491 RepID=A0A376BTM4_9NEIS|nr:phage tail protein [Alysiella crassa]UOP05873.1 phage tail protein [Alysiella crassa]SSY80300.1 Phage tail protein [Alysiella crassa]
MAVGLADGSTVHIGNGLATAKNITAITNANPPVATCTGHGLTTGDFVVIQSGWSLTNERCVKVETVDANSFKILGVDARDAQKYPAATGVGSFRKVTGFTEITQILSVSFSGGEQQYATFGFLNEDFERQIPTTVSAMSATYSIADDPNLPGYKAAKAASETGGTMPKRIDLKNGGQIVYNGYPSLNEVPTLEKGNVMAVSLSYALAAKPVRY